MILHLGCIVEGHGDVVAVPVLLRRIGQMIAPHLELRIGRPVRIPRSKIVKPNELERCLELLARQTPSPRAFLVLIDADDDCPKQLGPALLARGRQVRPDVPLAVVLAKHEFEAWFLAAIESLGGHRGLGAPLESVPDPENIRDAKARLTRLMIDDRAYAETIDQPAMAQRFDMKRARQFSASFDKCWRDVERLFSTTSD